ncbi:twitching motility protein PilT [Bacteroidia bacterium]|nr:twitching motility protein PilT [Bacteroidia bacterium]
MILVDTSILIGYFKGIGGSPHDKLLDILPFYDLYNGRKSYENAALMYMKCRKSGITIRSTVDLIIAQTAIENNLYLLHNDNDYINIATVVPDLKLYE